MMSMKVTSIDHVMNMMYLENLNRITNIPRSLKIVHILVLGLRALICPLKMLMNMMNMKVMRVPALVMMNMMNMMDVILMIMRMNLIYLASTGSQQKSWILL